MGGKFPCTCIWRRYWWPIGLVNTASFKDTFKTPSSTIVGLIVAIYEVGCFLGSCATSIFGEQLGRRNSTLVGVIIMILGAICQAAASSRAFMVFARIVSGVGMGKFSKIFYRLIVKMSQVLSIVSCLLCKPSFRRNLQGGSVSSSISYKVRI